MVPPAAPVVRNGPNATAKGLQRTLACCALFAALAMAAQIFTALAARHEISQVESIVAIQARMLASGDGLYYDLQRYPFTISPYGPLFYSLSAALQTIGVPALAAGRLLSICALIALLWLGYRLVWSYTSDRDAAVTATVLLASTANVLQWGTVGQVDTLALCFSLAALLAYSRCETTNGISPLIWTGVWILLAVFTKQNFVAAGATIALLILLRDTRRGLIFSLTAGLTGAALALSLDHFTQGGFFENAVLANLNPHRFEKLSQHLRYLLPAAGGLLLIAVCGWKARPVVGNKPHPLVVYLFTSITVLVLTAPKIGSDLNYQIETLTALCLCAGWTLHRLDFFALWQRRDPGWVTLLQIPLLLHVVLNLSLTAKTVLERNALEQVRRHEASVLRPYFTRSNERILSVQIDPLLQNRQRLLVEPLIYTLLVDAGVVDPEPVRDDLAKRRFALVVLYEDVFALPESPRDPEIPSLPAAHREEIRRNYQLVGRVPGALLDGVYLYRPVTR